MSKLSYFLTALLIPFVSYAQTYNTVEYTDINNIKAGVLSHGDMWWDYATGEPLCEFPKGSGKHIMSAGALWIGGYSIQSFHAAAQTYRQTGTDFWPGPVSASNDPKWARIWKINKLTIDSFKAMSTHTLANTPVSILEWPAKNNPSAKGAGGITLTITADMAPFVDVNKDGSYNPLAGDYPNIKGDQMLWWVFNDNGVHTSTQAEPMKLQIHACAYGYKRNTLIDNVIYYEYYIHNKSSFKYDSCVMGIWTDAELGYAQDDYVGFDSSRRMGYVYNGSTVDGTGALSHYGTQIPVAGITLLRVPGDAPPVYKPAGSFMYYNNGMAINGNPTNGVQYYYYLTSSWRDGSHLKNDFGNGTGTGPIAKYVYPGDPAINTQWSECAANNPPGDRRFVVATDDFSFKAGETILLAFALVTTDPATGAGCPTFTKTKIKDVADTAWFHFDDPVGINQISHAQKSLQLYPNPAHDKLFIETGKTGGDIYIYDAMGKKIAIDIINSHGKVEINTSPLPAGIYHIIYRNEGEYGSAQFLKE